MYDLYGDRYSGNCYKIQLLLNQLQAPYRWHEINILKGESRRQEFLAMNPNGRVPLLKLPDGRCVAESNAILYFLADGSALLPGDRYERACVLQWQAFEQYSHEPYIATSRFIRRYLGNPAEREADLDARSAPGYAALKVMDEHLARHDFFAAQRYTIADISLSAYTPVAHEGGFDLQAYSNVRTWLTRINAHADPVLMASPPALQAD